MLNNTLSREKSHLGTIQEFVLIYLGRRICLILRTHLQIEEQILLTNRIIHTASSYKHLCGLLYFLFSGAETRNAEVH